VTLTISVKVLEGIVALVIVAMKFTLRKLRILNALTMKDVRMYLLATHAVSIYLEQAEAEINQVATGAKSAATDQTDKMLYHLQRTAPTKTAQK
jgi:hypothetical protein